MGQRPPSWSGGPDLGSVLALEHGMPSADAEQVLVVRKSIGTLAICRHVQALCPLCLLQSVFPPKHIGC